MAELMKLADKDFKTATINITKDLKENMIDNEKSGMK